MESQATPSLGPSLCRMILCSQGHSKWEYMGLSHAGNSSTKVEKKSCVCFLGTDTLLCPAHLILYLRDWIQICCCKKRFSAFVWGWLQVHLLCFSSGLVRNKQIWYLFSLTQTPSAFHPAFEVRWGFHWCLSLKKLIHHLEMPTAFIFYASLYLAARISWDLLGGFFSS